MSRCQKEHDELCAGRRNATCGLWRAQGIEQRLASPLTPATMTGATVVSFPAQRGRESEGPWAFRSDPRQPVRGSRGTRYAPSATPGLVILRAVADDASPSTGERASERLVPAKIRDVSFPASVRGYDRRAVDDYVKSVNQVIAELEIRSSPQAAVRHALEQVGEQTTGILQRSRETAEEIIASARQEAEEITARAKAEAAEIVVNASTEAERERAEAEEFVAKARAEAEEILANSRAEAEETLANSRAEAEKALAQSRADAAQRLQRSKDEVAALREEAEARMRELDADTESLRGGRQALLDDMRGMTARLEELTREAAARFPPREPAEPAEEEIPALGGAETEPLGVAATDEPPGAIQAIRPHEGQIDEPATDERE
jgi:DivIVA domain-containing protein